MMKFMIIGSCSPESEDFSRFKKYCHEVSDALLEMDATLVFSSLFDDSADYWVYSDFVKHSRNIEIHYPNIQVVIDRMQELSVPDEVIKKPYVESISSLNMNYAYLYCQLNAMESADVIIAIGGSQDGSASLLLSLAKKNKIVIPIINFGGAAKQYYESNRYVLQDFMPDIEHVLISGSPKEILCDFLTCKVKFDGRVRSGKGLKIFISYARENSCWADMTEVFLRRRKINIFRDESDFQPGMPIQEHIMQELRGSDIFIALWCKEYACSPWCYDEIEEALDRFDTTKIWIIKVDDTRIVPKRARNLHYETVQNRQELEGLLSKLLEAV